MLRFKFRTNVLSGKHQVERLSYQLYYYNKSKILIVGDVSSSYCGHISKITSILKNDNFNVKVHTLKCGAFCTEEDVDTIVAKYLESNCDTIIALGDQKIISACKCAKALLDNNAKSIDELTQYSTALDKVFLTIIPTTIDSHKALDGSAFVWDGKNKSVKKFIADQLMPSLLIVDENMCEDIPIEEAIENFVLAFGMASCSIIDESLSNLLKAMSFTSLDIMNQAFNNIKLPGSTSVYKIILALSYSGLAFSKLPNNILDDIAQAISIKYAIPYRKIFICLFHSYLIKAIALNSESADEMLVNLLSIEEYVKVPEDKRIPTIIKVIEDILKKLKDACNINFSLMNLGVKIKDIDSIIDYVLKSKGGEDNKEKRLIIESIIMESL